MKPLFLFALATLVPSLFSVIMGSKNLPIGYPTMMSEIILFLP